MKWAGAAIVAALMLAAPASRAHAEGCTLMLDLSGSMRGYAAEQGPSALSRLVERLGKACGPLVGFGDRSRRLDGFPSRKGFADGKTLIGEAVGEWSKANPAGVAVVVTDNIADAGAAGGDQRRFYDLIGKGGFGFVTVTLLRLPFDGTVFAPSGAASPTPYRGERALTVYVLGRGDAAGAQAALKATEAALEREGLARGDGGDRQFTTVRLAPLALSSGAAPPVRLRRGKGVTVDEGRIAINPASADAAVDFEVQIEPALSRDWAVTAAPISAELAFPDTPLFGAATTTPCRSEPKALPAGAKTVKLDITCHVPPISASASAEQLHALARKGRAGREGVLRVDLKVERESLALSGPLSRWSFTGAPAELANGDAAAAHRAVYGLGELLTRMIPERELTTAIVSAPVVQRAWRVEIGSGTARTLRNLLIAAVLIAAVAALAVGRDYEILGDGAEARSVRRVRPLVPIVVDPGGRSAILTLTPVIAGFIATARAGEVEPSFLRREGGTVTLKPGGKVSVRPAKGGRPERGPRSGQRRPDSRRRRRS